MLFLVSVFLLEKSLRLSRHFIIQIQLLQFVVAVQVLILALVVIHGQEFDCKLPFLQACDLAPIPDS